MKASLSIARAFVHHHALVDACLEPMRRQCHRRLLFQRGPLADRLDLPTHRAVHLPLTAGQRIRVELLVISHTRHPVYKAKKVERWLAKRRARIEMFSCRAMRRN